MGQFLTDRRWNHNEPGDFLNLRSDVLQARVEAEPLAGVTIDATLRYNDAVEDQNYHEPRGLFDSDGDGVRSTPASGNSATSGANRKPGRSAPMPYGPRILAISATGCWSASTISTARLDLTVGRSAVAPRRRRVFPVRSACSTRFMASSDPATYNHARFQQNRLTEGYRLGGLSA